MDYRRAHRRPGTVLTGLSWARRLVFAATETSVSAGNGHGDIGTVRRGRTADGRACGCPSRTAPLRSAGRRPDPEPQRTGARRPLPCRLRSDPRSASCPSPPRSVRTDGDARLSSATGVDFRWLSDRATFANPALHLSVCRRRDSAGLPMGMRAGAQHDPRGLRRGHDHRHAGWARLPAVTDAASARRPARRRSLLAILRVPAMIGPCQARRPEAP